MNLLSSQLHQNIIQKLSRFWNKILRMRLTKIRKHRTEAHVRMYHFRSSTNHQKLYFSIEIKWPMWRLIVQLQFPLRWLKQIWKVSKRSRFSWNTKKDCHFEKSEKKSQKSKFFGRLRSKVETLYWNYVSLILS
jgi:flagellar motor switch protein FliM